MAESSAKVPTVVASSIIGIVVGAGIMFVFLTAALPVQYRYYTRNELLGEVTKEARDLLPPGAGGAPKGDKGGGDKGGGDKGGGGKKGGGDQKGGGGMGMRMGMLNPNRTLLLALVAKLDVLTGTSLAVQLTDEERAKVLEQLKGLDTADKLGDDEAKTRLDALLEILKDQKSKLQAVGFAWPAEPGAPAGLQPPNPPPNPFTAGDDAKHLQSLEKNLAK